MRSPISTGAVRLRTNCRTVIVALTAGLLLHGCSDTAMSADEALRHAATLHRLGEQAWDRREIRRAEAYLQDAVEIREELAPESLELAASLNRLGALARMLGDRPRAERCHRRALEIRQHLAPGSLEVAGSFNNLGNVLFDEGDLDAAQDHFQHALEIKKNLVPGSLDMANTLNNLGNIEWRRGELEQAREYLQRALTLYEKHPQASRHVASVLINLGRVATDRLEPDQAEDHYHQALKVLEVAAPRSSLVAKCLHNLGALAGARGDSKGAAAYFQRSLKIKEHIAPESLDVANSLDNLGLVARDQGDLEEAERYFQRALSIRQKLAPASLDVAISLNNLGMIAQDAGEPDQALAQFRKALAIRKRLAPESLAMAVSLNNLGLLELGRGDPQSAARRFEGAVGVLEAQIDKLGGSQDLKGNYRAQYGHYYRRLIRALLRLDRRRDAFDVLERSRARSFLAMLAERDVLSTGVPEALEKRRRSLERRYDELQLQMARLDTTEKGYEELSSEQVKILSERRALIEEIREASPRVAALRYPRPLGFSEAQEALDPGSVMLSYSVGKERTDLFVVTRDQPLRVEAFDVGEDELWDEVRRFRNLIGQARRDSKLGKQRIADLKRIGRRLYQGLVKPVADVVDAGDRILFVPDGPLHLLPFGALTDRDGRYLTEWKPIHVVISATVFAEMKKARQPSGRIVAGASPMSFTAFAQPGVPANLSRGNMDDVSDVRLRSVLRRGLFDELTSLPYSRQEVERITKLFPPEAARAYLGQQATEERAKSVGKETRILHFAVHSHLDDHFPLNSALVLTIPEELGGDRDNGLLQAWEVFQDIRLDADLVVLSSCRSGLGKEQGGEGLIGLTRAFQYAGARSVIASLWRVEDRATAELMERFYRHLRGGSSKDEALRAAQLELIRPPAGSETTQTLAEEWAEPYYWAAFQVIGDWR